MVKRNWLYIGKKKEYSKKNYAMYLMNKNIRFYNGTYQIFYSTIYPIDPPNPPEVNRNWRKCDLTLFFYLQSAKIMLVHPNSYCEYGTFLYSSTYILSSLFQLCDSITCRSSPLLKVIVKSQSRLNAIHF